MLVGIPREGAPRERRVAAAPATVATYRSWGWEVVVEATAGAAAGFPDDVYASSGARLGGRTEVHHADVVLRVGPPTLDEVELLAAGTILIGFLDPFVELELVTALAHRRVSALAIEALPRVTLAQTMDALSSQATAAGYAAVLLGAEEASRFLPMLVTAAGTIPPSRLLVLGVGVAGLQAIATARRLGAVVHAYDIRPETREQVESLGGHFVDAPTEAADEAGYAQEVDTATRERQFAVLAPVVADSDLVITTAQIPGRPAPLLVSTEMVRSMKPGSVIVDGAAATGGNVEPSRADEVVVVDGVRIYGPTDLASRVATDASRMYARNLQELLQRMGGEDGTVTVDLDDEIVGGCTIIKDGEIVHPRAKAAPSPGEEQP